MTISSSYSADTYAGDDSTTSFAVTFQFLSAASNVKVSLKDNTTGVITAQTQPTHYSVSGSNVVMVTAPASGTTVIVELDPDFQQNSDYVENSALPAETLEADLDERCIEGQINKDIASRGIRLDASVTGVNSVMVVDTTIANNSDKYLKFNSDGDGLEISTLSATAGLGNIVEDVTPQLGAQLDVNGYAIGDGTLELVEFTEDASAVNHINVANAATSSDPAITAVGDDTNVGLTIDTKGTGTLTLGSADAPVSVPAGLSVAGAVDVASEIQHTGDTDNKIGFTADTQTYTTGGSTRLDITNSGVQLGGTGARVTAILDEDAMSSNSAIALATQQSIKTYVDNNAGVAASQTEQEAGALTTRFVSPGTQQYHPSASKCWVSIWGSYAPADVHASYNLTSITDNGTGDYSINIATDFSAAEYAAAGIADSSSAGNSAIIQLSSTAPTAGVYRVNVRDSGGGSFGLVDVDRASIVLFGDQ